MLLPAAILVVLLLAAIAVDRAVVFGAQRDLVATAEAAANDAAAAGVDLDQLRREGTVSYDGAAIDRAVHAAADRADGTVLARWHLDGAVVVVELQRRVDLVFTKGVPGAGDQVVVRATARAELRRS